MSRQRFPRQSAASSDGAATASSSEATTPTAGTASSSGSDPTLSGSAPATASGPSSSPTSATAESSTSPPGSTAVTPTSDSTGTTSTSQSSSHPSSTSSSDSSAKSQALATSSSIPPSPTSSTASSSPVPPSPTTQPPASSSQPGIQTTVTSSYTTYINGSPVLTQTTYPSTIPATSGPSTSSNRAAIIGGSAAGGTAVLILLLSLAFCARRKRFKRLNFLDAITRKRKQIHSRATLLDGEDLAEVGLQHPPQRYTDHETLWDAGHSRNQSNRTLMTGIATPGTPQTLTRPSRWSETGSAFREEVWPPPHEGTQLMDPLANRDDLDLGRIVDDVMGPSSTAAHYSDRSVSSMYRDSVVESDGVPHSRTVSNASNAALLEAAGLGGTLGAGMGSPLTTAPVRSSPLAHPGTHPGSAEHHGQNTS